MTQKSTKAEKGYKSLLDYDNASRVRSFHFTWNNWTEENKDFLADFAEKRCKYMVYGEEIGDEVTRHLQGYLMLPNAVTWGSMKKTMKGAHVEPALGGPIKGYEYCTKGGDPSKITEFGEKPFGQGRRTDLTEIRARLVVNKDLLRDVVLDLGTNLQQIKYAESLEKYLRRDKKYLDDFELYWFWGESEAGKTREAHELLRGRYGHQYWEAGSNLRWFDEYNGQEGVLIDEFDGSYITFRGFLKMFDKRPVRVELKVGHTTFAPKTVVITCEFHPKDVWSKNEGNMRQLMRRIKEVKMFGQGIRTYKNGYHPNDAHFPDERDEVREAEERECEGRLNRPTWEPR